MLTVLWFIIVGAVIGVLARLVVPGRNSIGVLLTILVGIVGALLGGVIANSLGAGSLVAVVFAILIAAVGVALLTSTQRGGGWHGWRTHRRTH